MAKVLIIGIDISNHQGKARLDLDKLLTKHPEIRVVIIKSSEGTHYDDAYDEEFIKIALAHGCIVGVYHFARASKNGWLAEAKFFLSLTKKYKGKVFYVLDWEERAAAHKVEWAESWLAYVAKETGSTPIFYSYESLINSANYSKIAKYPLWVAKYRDYDPDKNFDMSNAGKAPNVKWWSSYIGWQWTSVGRLDGYNGNLDCTAFYVDEAALRKCIGMAVPEFKHSRSAIVSEAISHIGVKEGTTLHHKIIDRYNSQKSLPRGYKVKYTDAWCATFVSFLAIVMGYTDIIPVECGCPQMIELAKQMGIWVEDDGYVPKPGDIPLYDWQDSGKGDNAGTPDHIGLAEKVVSGTITVIEGNYKDAVGRREIAVNGRYIRGYIVPRYDDETTSENQKQPESAKETATVDYAHTVDYYAKVNTKTDPLNVRVGPGTKYKQCSFSPIPKGAKVGVCKYKVGQWYLVKYNGKYGFVHSAYLKKI
jgi:GH25 family lysozyme M1 (1,4-beta-N-acetylmuramidase)